MQNSNESKTNENRKEGFSMRARRVDANQKELVKQMRKIPGVTVRLLSMVGQDLPDAVVGFKGKNYMMEIKDPNQPPSKRKLRPGQEDFFKSWQGQVAKVETIDDVLRELDLTPRKATRA